MASRPPDDQESNLPARAGSAPVRVSDADRNVAIEELRRFCGEGLLTLDEFSDRVTLVFEATTRADLNVVVADLRTTPLPEPERRTKVSRTVVGIMSGARRTGRWRPGEELNTFAFMGGCEIDLRQAEIDNNQVLINATSIMGGIDIIVPDGIRVEVDEFHFMGAVETKLSDVPLIPGSPVVRIKAFALMGSVIIRTKRTRAERDAARQVRRQESIDRRERMLENRQDRHERFAERRLERYGITLPATPAPPAPPARPAARAPRARADREIPSETDLRSQLAGHAAPDGTVTILFSDVVGYTELTERLGDIRAHELLQKHNEILRAQVASCDGYEVKSQGDGFMVAFAGASRALRCAIAIQRAFADYCAKYPGEPISVHIGLNTGEVLRDGDDFLGRTVILASRIANEAKGDEILVSSLVKALADGSGEFLFDIPRDVALKGISLPQTVFPVVWQI